MENWKQIALKGKEIIFLYKNKYELCKKDKERIIGECIKWKQKYYDLNHQIEQRDGKIEMMKCTLESCYDMLKNSLDAIIGNTQDQELFEGSLKHFIDEVCGDWI